MADSLDVFVGGIFGALAAIVFCEFVPPPIVNNVKVFPRENKPAVMRLYKTGADGILVEDSKNPGSYVLLGEHLKTIPDEADRKIEQAEIEKAVEWYK